MRSVGVIGTGQTDHTSKRLDVSLAGLVREATLRALDDAELTYDDIDAVVLGSAPDFFEGVMQPEQLLAGALGANGIPITRIHTAGSGGGSTAICAATHARSGLFDRVLAVAFEKLSETDPLWGLSPKTGTGRLFGAGAGAHFAPFCRMYIDAYGAAEEIGPRIVVKARENAGRNPHAHLRAPVTVQEVLDSPVLWDPFHRLESCPTSDGAAAMVFASAEGAAGRDAVAWVHGAAAKAEAATFPGRDNVDPVVGRETAAEVYQQAGVHDPLSDLDVAEIYEPFSWIEVMWYENLGFAERGEGWRLFDRGETAMDGTLPVNPSGGVLSTNPIGASGLIRMLEAADQVRGRAGDHQIDGARRALGHAYGGSSNYMAMMVFGSEQP
ncbi:MAG: thiolase domain-containing protein [Actinobacteria bacterium]|nr:thiolase domain-containing protein [Actinomycetota bacterium]